MVFDEFKSNLSMNPQSMKSHIRNSFLYYNRIEVYKIIDKRKFKSKTIEVFSHWNMSSDLNLSSFKKRTLPKLSWDEQFKLNLKYKRIHEEITIKLQNKIEDAKNLHSSFQSHFKLQIKARLLSPIPQSRFCLSKIISIKNSTVINW